jgi:AAA15 family ATPase/GTPase
LNEPENSLHPQMLPALASLIAEASRYSQIWLTSHSPELATLIEKQRSFSLYQLSMTEGDAGGEAGVVSMGTEAVFSHLASVKHANKEPQIPGPA